MTEKRDDGELCTQKCAPKGKRIDWIVTDPKGIYVDCTLGGAGHSHAIAEKLDPEGLLIGIDQDEDAIMAASKRLEDAACKVKIVHSNFRNLGTILEGLNLHGSGRHPFLTSAFLPISWIRRNGGFPICMMVLLI